MAETLTVKEVADIFKIHPHSIYNGIGRKAKYPFPIKPVRIGRRVRFSKSDVDDYINKKE